MVKKKSSLPPVTTKDVQLRQLLSAIAEDLNISNGLSGDPMDQKITWRDLASSGLAKFTRSISPGRGVGPGDITPPPTPDDSYIPEQIENFEAIATFQSVILLWDASSNPILTYAEIYRSTENNFSTATVIARDQGRQFTDRDVVEEETYYYWARFVNSRSGIEGPLNATDGAMAVIPQSAQTIIEELTGRITESQFHDTLTGRLDAFETDISASLSSVSALEISQNNTQAVLDSVDQTVQTAQAEITDIEVELDSVSSQVTQNRQDVIGVSDQLDQAFNELTSISNDVVITNDNITLINNELVAVNNEIYSAHQELSTLGDQLGVVNLDVSQAQTDIDTITNSLNETRNEVSQAQTDIDTINISLNETSNEVSQAQTDIDTINISLNETSNEVSQAQTEIENISDSLAQTNLDVVQANQDIASANSEILLAQQSVTSLSNSVQSQFEDLISSDSSAQTQIESLALNMGDVSSRVDEVEASYVSSDEALSAQVLTVQTKVDQNESAITNEVLARSSADNSLAAQITTVQSNVDDNTASITAEQIARTDSDSALAAQITAIEANFNGAISDIESSQSALQYELSSLDNLTLRESVTGEMGDAVFGQDATLIVRNIAGPRVQNNDTSGASFIIPEAQALNFMGKKVRIDVLARPDQDNPADGLSVIYSTADNGNSGQLTANFSSETNFEWFTFFYDVPMAVSGGTDYFGMYGSLDVNADPAGVEYARVVIRVASSAEEIPEIAQNSAAINSESIARADADGALASQIDTLEATTNNLSAAITTEQTARTTADDALAAEISTVQSSVDDNAAEISNEVIARTNADSALAGQITALETQVDGNTSSITAEQVARTDADSALAGQINIVQSSANDNQAAITQEQLARSGADDALSIRLDTVESETNNLSAAITTEQTARTTADDALAAQITSVQSNVDDNTAEIAAETIARTDTDSALGGRIDTLQVEVDGNLASISSESLARADADSALAAQITIIESSIDNNSASITAEQVARSSADSALSSEIASVQSSVEGNSALITAEQVARTSADEALSNQITTLEVQVDDNSAQIINESAARTSADEALSSQIVTVQSNVDQNATEITNEVIARTNVDSALGGRIDTLQTEVDGNAASITAEQIARTDSDSALAAQITAIEANFNGAISDIESSQSALQYELSSLDNLTLRESVTGELGDAVFGQDATLIVRNIAGSRVQTTDTSGASFIIPEAQALNFMGKKVRIDVLARPDQDNPADGLSVIYSTADNGNSGQLTANFSSETNFEWFTFFYDVPMAVSGGTDYFGMFGSLDVNADPAGVEYARVVIRVASSAEEIPEIAQNSAAINSESIARADADGALASQIDTIEATTNNLSAAITTEQTARTTADDALAAEISTVQSSVDDNAAEISNEVIARTNADSALAGQITALETQVDGNTSSITAEQVARTDADSALASQINIVQSSANDNQAAITQEQLARSGADDALSIRLDTVESETNNLSASITTEQTARTTADDALAAEISTVQSSVDDNSALIQAESLTRSSADDALAAQISVVESNVSDNESVISSEIITRANADTALGGRIDLIQTEVAGNASLIANVQQTLTTETESLATQINTVSASAGAANDSIDEIRGMDAGLLLYPESINEQVRYEHDGLVRSPLASEFSSEASNTINVTRGVLEIIDTDEGQPSGNNVLKITCNDVLDSVNEGRAFAYLSYGDNPESYPSIIEKNTKWKIPFYAKSNIEGSKGVIRVKTNDGLHHAFGFNASTNWTYYVFELDLSDNSSDGLVIRIDSTDYDEINNRWIMFDDIRVVKSEGINYFDNSVEPSMWWGNTNEPFGTISEVNENNPSGTGIIGLAEQTSTGGAFELIKNKNNVIPRLYASEKTVTALLFRLVDQNTSLQFNLISNLDVISSTIIDLSERIILSDNYNVNYRFTDLALGFVLLEVEHQVQVDYDLVFARIILRQGLNFSPVGHSIFVQSAFFGKSEQWPSLYVAPTFLGGSRYLIENEVFPSILENSAKIESEENARVDGDTALASEISTVQSNVDTNTAAITAEQVARTSADEALSNQITTLEVQVDDNSAQIINESTARTSADEALSSQIVTVQSNVDLNATEITNEVIARTDADTALGGRIDTLQTEVDGNSASIYAEQVARTDADSALAGQILSLDAAVNENTSSIETESLARSSADNSLAAQITTVQSNVDDNTAEITAETIARTDADSALGGRIDTLQAEVDGNSASISSESLARADADSALAGQITALETQVDGNAASITSESLARADADSALGGRIDTLQTEVDDNAASITAEQIARTDSDSALAAQITAIEANFNGAISDIESSQSALQYELSSLDNLTLRESVTGELGDALFGQDATLIVRNIAGPRVQSNDTSGASFIIPEAQALNFMGKKVRIDVLARPDQDNPADGLSVIYSTADNGNSGQLTANFSSETNFEWFTFFYDVPMAVSGGTDYFGMFGSLDVNANPAGVEYARVVIRVASSAEEIPEIAQNSAAINSESIARADADGALASQIDTLETTANNLSAAITTEQTARTTADNALAAEISTLEASTGRINDLIEDPIFEFGNAYWSDEYEGNIVPSSSIGQSVSLGLIGGKALRVSEGGSTSLFGKKAIAIDVSRSYKMRIRIKQEIDDIGSSNIFAGVATLDMTYQNISGGAGAHRFFCVSNESITEADNWIEFEGVITGEGDSPLEFRPGTKYVRPVIIVNFNQGSGTALLDEVNFYDATEELASEARIQDVQTVLTNENLALAERVSTTESAIDQNTANITTLEQTVVEANSSSVSRLTNLELSAAVVQNDIDTIIGEELDAAQALARVGDVERDLETIATGSDANLVVIEGWINQEANLRQNEDTALAETINSIGVQTDSLEATLTETRSAFIDEGSGLSFAQSINQLRSVGENNSAFLQTIQETVVDPNLEGGSYALWRVASDVNGLTGGIGFINDGEEVSVAISANRFYIYDENNPDEAIIPFAVEDGVTYIDTAYIREGTIDALHIGSVNISSLEDGSGNAMTIGGRLRAEAIDTDNLTVSEAATFTGDATSTTYSNGLAGWELKQDGTATFENLTANGGVFKGNLSASSDTVQAGEGLAFTFLPADGSPRYISPLLMLRPTNDKTGMVIDASNDYGLFIEHRGIDGDALRTHSFNNDGGKFQSYHSKKAGVRAVNTEGCQIVLGNNAGGSGDYTPSKIYDGAVFPEVIVGGLLGTRNGLWYGLKSGSTFYWFDLVHRVSKFEGDPIVYD